MGDESEVAGRDAGDGKQLFCAGEASNQLADVGSRGSAALLRPGLHRGGAAGTQSTRVAAGGGYRIAGGQLHTDHQSRPRIPPSGTYGSGAPRRWNSLRGRGRSRVRLGAAGWLQRAGFEGQACGGRMPEGYFTLEAIGNDALSGEVRRAGLPQLTRNAQRAQFENERTFVEIS